MNMRKFLVGMILILSAYGLLGDRVLLKNVLSILGKLP